MTLKNKNNTNLHPKKKTKQTKKTKIQKRTQKKAGSMSPATQLFAFFVSWFLIFLVSLSCFTATLRVFCSSVLVLDRFTRNTAPRDCSARHKNCVGTWSDAQAKGGAAMDRHMPMWDARRPHLPQLFQWLEQVRTFMFCLFICEVKRRSMC